MASVAARRVLGRLAGAVAATGLAAAGLVVAAAPASAAACSGTSGVTVVVDTGGSTSTRCASGDPSSALKALTGAGFSVTYPQQFYGTVVCRIDGYPESDPCFRMPPGDAYWAFFHAKRGGSWVYSSTGVASYDPSPGTVVGFRFGSGQQPRIAPPAPPKTSEPAPTKTTSEPDPTTAAPKATTTRTTTHAVDGAEEHRLDGRGGRPGIPDTRGVALGEPVGLPHRFAEHVRIIDAVHERDRERVDGDARGRHDERRGRRVEWPGHPPRRRGAARPRRRGRRLGRLEATLLTR